MYLSEQQVNSLLSSDFFSQPVTESVSQYAMYRGRLNATVVTYRFNINPQYSNRFMIGHLMRSLQTHFSLNTRLLASIDFDFLLTDPNAIPPTFYIWRANSNLVHFNIDNEIMMRFTYDNLFRFVNNAANVDFSTLNIHFTHSNVVIKKVITLVLSFIKI